MLPISELLLNESMITDILTELQNYFENFDLKIKNGQKNVSFDTVLKSIHLLSPIILASNGQNQHRYSYIGLRPIASICGDAKGTKIELLFEHKKRSQLYDYDVFEFIEMLFQNIQSPTQPFFTGGVIGVLPYRYNLKKNFSYHYQMQAAKNLVIHEKAFFYIITTLLVYDHYESCIFFCFPQSDTAADDLVSSIETQLQQNDDLYQKKPTHPCSSKYDYHLQPQIDFSTYKNQIEKALYHLKYGNIYQVNIACLFQAQLPDHFSTFDFFCFLQKRFASPYGGYFAFDETQLISNSPECFLRYDALGRIISTFPIKGTAKRHFDKQQDSLLANQLVQSVKDSAEHIMIVDLERNDLSKIAQPKSVKVSEYKVLHSFATVHHLISKIEAHVKKNISLQQIIDATFPTGSITGAPKKRALEIIDEIETFERDFYTGSLGYIGYDNSFCFNVLIRTAECFQNQLFLKLGSGIVIDSTPLQEYDEILAKGLAFSSLLDEYRCDTCNSRI